MAYIETDPDYPIYPINEDKDTAYGITNREYFSLNLMRSLIEGMSSDDRFSKIIEMCESNKMTIEDYMADCAVNYADSLIDSLNKPRSI